MKIYPLWIAMAFFFSLHALLGQEKFADWTFTGDDFEQPLALYKRVKGAPPWAPVPIPPDRLLSYPEFCEVYRTYTERVSKAREKYLRFLAVIVEKPVKEWWKVDWRDHAFMNVEYKALLANDFTRPVGSRRLGCPTSGVTDPSAAQKHAEKRNNFERTLVESKKDFYDKIEKIAIRAREESRWDVYSRIREYQYRILQEVVERHGYAWDYPLSQKF